MPALRTPSIEPELGVRASKFAPVIIATDGRRQSDAAMVVGKMLAPAPNALKIVSVVRPLPIVPESGMVVNGELALSRRADAQREAIAQMTRTLEQLAPLDVLEGDPATVVAGVAHRSAATMIVCGLGRHRVTDRIFGDETALRFIRVADVPVLAVAEALNRAPSRIVVACDFSETSLRAARTAIGLASTNAFLYLVHVAPRGMKADREGWGRTYREEATDALIAVHEQLRAPADMVVERVLVEGDPATEIISFASGVNADLIATGSHGHGFIARMLIGSVATRIVRASTCSVLTVPHSAVMTDAGVSFTAARPQVLEFAK